MRSRSHAPASSSPSGPRTAPSPGARQPRGNAALAEQLAAQATQQGEGTEVAMGRGQVAGMLAGFGMAAANALGSGGLPAVLNPNDYWDTMPEPVKTELLMPTPAARLKPAN